MCDQEYCLFFLPFLFGHIQTLHLQISVSLSKLFLHMFLWSQIFYCTIRILRKNLSFSIKDIVSTWPFSHKFYALFLLHQARHILFFLIYLCPNSWSWKIKQPKFNRTPFLVFNTWPHFFFWLFKKRQSPFLLIINPRKEIFWWIYILFSISAIGFQYFHH